MKRHLSTGRHTKTACNRVVAANTWHTESPASVTCLACQNSGAYQALKAEQDAARLVAFMAQTPRHFGEPWKTGETITCKTCGGKEFRNGDRTCHGHYDNFHCAECGNVESRLTETGMSF